MLFTLSRAFSHYDFQLVTQLPTQNDVVLLFQDGVTAAVESDALIQLRQTQATLYALLEDLQARGLTDLCAADVKPISYDEFVALSVAHYPQIAW